MTTGTSVLGLKFDGGVLMAADTLGKWNCSHRKWEVRYTADVGSFY